MKTCNKHLVYKRWWLSIIGCGLLPLQILSYPLVSVLSWGILISQMGGSMGSGGIARYRNTRHQCHPESPICDFANERSRTGWTLECLKGYSNKSVVTTIIGTSASVLLLYFKSCEGIVELRAYWSNFKDRADRWHGNTWSLFHCLKPSGLVIPVKLANSILTLSFLISVSAFSALCNASKFLISITLSLSKIFSLSLLHYFESDKVRIQRKIITYLGFPSSKSIFPLS